ncbi:hypothetical protein AAVH_34589 [Aphelenchoides avenae]|nr:hypothetical protein AAVH_34589 [Aphelenchus avenae]
MAVDFYVTLPSNTKTDLNNKTSSFTVRLQKKLQFNSTWVVGLVSILYPYSWPNLGTDDYQYVDVKWKSGVSTRLWILCTAYRTLERLPQGIEAAIREGADHLCSIGEEGSTRKRRATDGTPASAKKPRSVKEEEVTEVEEELHPPLDTEYIAAKSVDALTREKKQLADELATAREDLRAQREKHEKATTASKKLIKELKDRIDALIDTAADVGVGALSTGTSSWRTHGQPKPQSKRTMSKRSRVYKAKCQH